MYRIYDLPHWAGAVLFSVLFVGITCLVVVLIRPWVRRHAVDQPDWNAMISTALSAYGVFYGITLALIAFATYQNFAAAENAVKLGGTIPYELTATPRGMLHRHLSIARSL